MLTILNISMTFWSSGVACNHYERPDLDNDINIIRIMDTSEIPSMRKLLHSYDHEPSPSDIISGAHTFSTWFEGDKSDRHYAYIFDLLGAKLSQKSLVYRLIQCDLSCIIMALEFTAISLGASEDDDVSGQRSCTLKHICTMGLKIYGCLIPMMDV